MNAGLPGTGIGGLFYLISALFMPVHRALFGGGHDGRSWGRIIPQCLIACGILAMIFVTLWGLDYFATIFPELAARTVGKGAAPVAETTPPTLLRWFVMLGALGALVIVLGAVELVRFALRRGPAIATLAEGPEREMPDFAEAIPVAASPPA